jgi:hypothetical protein
VLWAALQPPDAALAALVQFRHEVGEASRRLEAAEAVEAARKAASEAAPAGRRSRKVDGAGSA